MNTIDYTNAYITMTDRDSLNDYHRSPIILHQDWQWHLSNCQTVEQLDELAKILGFTYEFAYEEACARKRFGSELLEEKWKQRYYRLSHRFAAGKVWHTYTNYAGRQETIPTEYFWSLDELPDGAKPIMGHSNGSLVDCYFTNDGKTIKIYRPNPNAPEVYHPIPLEEHIAYEREHAVL